MPLVVKPAAVGCAATGCGGAAAAGTGGLLMLSELSSAWTGAGSSSRCSSVLPAAFAV